MYILFHLELEFKFPRVVNVELLAVEVEDAYYIR